MREERSRHGIVKLLLGCRAHMKRKRFSTRARIVYSWYLVHRLSRKIDAVRCTQNEQYGTNET